MKDYKKIVMSYYENLWNKKDKSYIDKLLSDEIIFRASLGIDVQGKKEFEEYFDMITNAIPNLHHGVETLVADGSNLAARAVYNGTHSGKLLEFEPTNKRIQYHGASFFKLDEEEKIKEIWVLGDLNSLYKQLI